MPKEETAVNETAMNTVMNASARPGMRDSNLAEAALRTRFQEDVERARRARQAQSTQSTEQAIAAEGGWADPDPRAIADLHSGTNPVDRVLALRKGGADARKNARYRLRWTLAMLTGGSTGDISLDQVRAYPWHHVTPEDAYAYRLRVQARYARNATRNALLDGLRSVIKACLQARLIDHARMDDVLDGLEGFPHQPARRVRRLLPSELAALLQCEPETSPWKAARNRAIIAVFATTGLRVSEVVSLQLADWDQGSKAC